MEIHHIVPKEQGGDDSFDNGIPLCFDCHADVMAYNPKHPKGSKFTPSELREHRDQWFKISRRPPWARSPTAHPRETAPRSVQQLAKDIRKAELWNPDVLDLISPAVLGLGDGERKHLVGLLDKMLSEGGDNERWNAAIVVELLVDWDPRIVPAQLLERMARDSFFSVRSAAAVSYFSLAGSAPADVSLGTLAALAHWDEDWYVMTPATNALIRLAYARPVALELLARGLDEESPDAQRHASWALEGVARFAPNALLDEIAARLKASKLEDVRATGELWSKTIEERRQAGKGRGHHPF